MKNFIIGIVAVNESYIEKTKNQMNQILNHLDVEFLILTNKPNEFNNYKNITIINYNKQIFSYHDKRLIFEEGFKKYDIVLLLDADHGVRDQNFLNEVENLDIEPGVYPQILWKHPAECSFDNFILGKVGRVPYGIDYKNFCDENNYDITDVILIQESFLMIKKNKHIDTFLNVWKNLAEFCNNKDGERRQSILGYGEGYSIGVAVKNAGLEIFENHNVTTSLVRNFKHFAWER
jgi:hypothetical protein